MDVVDALGRGPGADLAQLGEIRGEAAQRVVALEEERPGILAKEAPQLAGSVEVADDHAGVEGKRAPHLLVQPVGRERAPGAREGDLACHPAEVAPRIAGSAQRDVREERASEGQPGQLADGAAGSGADPLEPRTVEQLDGRRTQALRAGSGAAAPWARRRA